MIGYSGSRGAKGSVKCSWSPVLVLPERPSCGVIPLVVCRDLEKGRLSAASVKWSSFISFRIGSARTDSAESNYISDSGRLICALPLERVQMATKVGREIYSLGISDAI